MSLYLEIAQEEGLDQAVIDYISGMSDEYCIESFRDIRTSLTSSGG